MKIIYPYQGHIAVINPAATWDYKEVARKDVPAGVPYLFVEDADLPTEDEFFNAWTADFSNPDGYGIGQEAWFAEQEAKKGEA
jgi:hypothetical protein